MTSLSSDRPSGQTPPTKAPREACPHCHKRAVMDGSWIDGVAVAKICIECGAKWPISASEGTPSPATPAVKCPNPHCVNGRVGNVGCAVCKGEPVRAVLHTPAQHVPASPATPAPSLEHSPWLVVNIGCIECGVSSNIVGRFADEAKARAVADALDNELSWREGGQNSFEVFDLRAPMADEYRAALDAAAGSTT